MNEKNLKYNCGNEVELLNDKTGIIIEARSYFYGNVYEVDLGDGVIANQVNENEIKKSTKEE